MRELLDLRLKVFVIALTPALRLARHLSLPLRDLEDAARVAYVRLLREEGLSLEQIARRIDTSRRTVATLSSLASAFQPLEISRPLSVRREIIRWLSRVGAGTIVDAGAAVDARPEEIADAVESLERDCAIDREGAKLRLTRAWTSYEGAHEAERLDSLRHFFDAVTETVHRRFDRDADDDEAFARVVTFSASPSAQARLRQELYALLCERAAEADAAAGTDAHEVSVALCVTRRTVSE